MFGFKGKLKWSIFINYYARSHILLTSGTHSSLLLLLQLRLHENWLSFNLNNPSSIANTLNSHFTSSAPPPSTPTILHHPLHLFFIPHPPCLCTQQPLGSVPLSSFFTKVETMPHPRTTVPSPFSQFLAKFSRSTFISSFHNIFTPTTCSILFRLEFCPSHSTQTLLHCLDKCYKALDTKRYVGTVFLNISKAFDTVSHELLLSKLTNLGLSSTAITWFRSYLSNRFQITRVLDSYSSPGFPSSGVPQGSILGPTLFSAFINDLPSVLPLNSTVLFADDTTIFIVSDDICSLHSSLQTCLNLANLWLQRNGLRLNTLKTKSMLIHSSRKVTDSTL